MLDHIDEMELLASVNPEPDITGNPWVDEPQPVALDPSRRRRRRGLWIGGAAAVAAAAVVAGVVLFAGDPTRRVKTHPAGPPTTATTPTTPTTVWSPVRDPSTIVHHMTVAAEQGSLTGRWKWHDPLDASVGWIDVKRIDYSFGDQTFWYLDLAAEPPNEDLEPGLVTAYGVVLDTTGDGLADYVIGLDDDAPKKGDSHVWVTNLATGKTETQSAPPYGFPIEFEPGWDPVTEMPMVLFTFLPPSEPADFNPESVRFYAWTSVTRDGKVIAHDYAPDTGWITATP